MKRALSIVFACVLGAAAGRGQWAASWDENFNVAVARSNIMWALDERLKAVEGDAYSVTNDGISSGYNVPPVGYWASSNWLAQVDRSLGNLLTNYYVNPALIAMNGIGTPLQNMLWTMPAAMTAAGYPGQTKLIITATWQPSVTNYQMRKALINLMTHTAGSAEAWVNPNAANNRAYYVSDYYSTWSAAKSGIADNSIFDSFEGQPYAYTAGEADTGGFYAYAHRAFAYPVGGAFGVWGGSVTSMSKEASLYLSAAAVGTFDAQGDGVAETWTDTTRTESVPVNVSLWTNLTWAAVQSLGVPPNWAAEPASGTRTEKGYSLYALWILDWTADAAGFRFK